jgi:hypothetical protein
MARMTHRRVIGAHAVLLPGHDPINPHHPLLSPSRDRSPPRPACASNRGVSTGEAAIARQGSQHSTSRAVSCVHALAHRDDPRRPPNERHSTMRRSGRQRDADNARAATRTCGGSECSTSAHPRTLVIRTPGSSRWAFGARDGSRPDGRLLHDCQSPRCRVPAMSRCRGPRGGSKAGMLRQRARVPSTLAASRSCSMARGFTDAVRPTDEHPAHDGDGWRETGGGSHRPAAGTRGGRVRPGSVGRRPRPTGITWTSSSAMARSATPRVPRRSNGTRMIATVTTAHAT